MTRATEGPRRGAVGVIVRDARFLVIRRSQTVPAPGKWCFPGGSIEPNESESDAVVRELQEELNISVVPQRCLWRSTTPWGVQLCWWAVEMSADQEPVPAPAEVETYRWLSLDELENWPEVLESLRHFVRAWKSGKMR